MQAFEIRPYTAYREEEITALYRSVGWVDYCEKPQLLRQAYRCSLCVLGAYMGGALVGAVRAVGDGCSVLYVQEPAGGP